MDLSSLTPVRIVELLDKHVHGQVEAKEALALTIRNRWRRLQLPKEVRDKVKKQNLLLKGPTGSGKTALVRAIELELGWPVHFVDITQYSETGYKGKDLDDIIRNFVEKYSETPLPEWYKESVKSQPEQSHPAATRTNTLLMASNVDLAKLYARAFWVHVCAKYEPVPFPTTNPPVTLEDGKTVPFFDLFIDIQQNYPETLGEALFVFRECEMTYPEIAQTLGGHPDMCAIIDHYRTLYEKRNGEITLPELRKHLSNDTGVTVERSADYIRFATQLVDRISLMEVFKFYQHEMMEPMYTNPSTFAPWWLWGSVIYDHLVRHGGWKPVRNPNRVHQKRLNAKARKIICDLYGFKREELERCSELGHLWGLVIRTERADGMVESPFDKTIGLITECAARRLVSPTWASNAPHKSCITPFIDPIGDGATKPWEKDNWEKKVADKVGMLRKFLRDSVEDYTVKRDPLKVWEEYVGVLKSSLRHMTKLYPAALIDFIGERPRRPQSEQRPWNILSDDPFDVQSLVRSALSRHLDNNSEQFNTNLQQQMSPDRDMVIRFIQDYGICFLDEIDKIGIDGSDQAMITRDGVQRGLLALVEGAEYPIKSANKFSDAVDYTFDTTNLMFVAAGAFSVSPLDALIPELRGRFPVVANIKPLTKDDYSAILQLPTSQVFYAKEMLKVEKVEVEVTEDGYAAMADVCLLMNQHANLGARRLESVIDRVFHEAMMEPDKFIESGFTINKEYVLGLDWSGTDLVIKFHDPQEEVKPIPVASN